MLDIKLASKNAYLSDRSKKNIRVVFPSWGETYTNENIVAESLKLTEAIANKDSVEFVGCISSCFQITLYNVQQDIKGRTIEVYVNADDMEEIPLFKGIVDSVVIEADKEFKKITAYDVLYSKGEMDIADWYKTFFYSTETTHTLKEIRDSVFGYIGIEQEDVELPNDDVVISKKYDPSTLKCITVLKSICQINGCFGIIGRDGVFNYRYIVETHEGLFPSARTYPGPTTYPSKGNIAYHFNFHEKLQYQEYFVKPTDKVQIRQSEKEYGVVVGSGTNKYIIQSNIFAQGLETEVLEGMAQAILDKIGHIQFHPFEGKNYGCPFLEVGDTIIYASVPNATSWNQINKFTIFSRTLSGIQIMTDSFNAKGTEEQSEFITDLQTTLETLKLNGGGGGDGYTKEEVDEKISEMETPTGFTVVSCYTLPETRRSDCIYLVKGDITML